MADARDCFTFECQPVAMHFRFYDTGYHRDNYVAQFFAFAVSEGVMAVKGLMDKSNGFYRQFSHLLPEVMNSFGAHTMLAEALPPHARLMQRFLRDVADVQIQETKAHDRDMALVTITLRG